MPHPLTTGVCTTINILSKLVAMTTSAIDADVCVDGCVDWWARAGAGACSVLMTSSSSASQVVTQQSNLFQTCSHSRAAGSHREDRPAKPAPSSTTLTMDGRFTWQRGLACTHSLPHEYLCLLLLLLFLPLYIYILHEVYILYAFF